MPKPHPNILLIGTVDTKRDEMVFMQECIRQLGATYTVMDVGILHGADDVDIHQDAVAQAAGLDIPTIIAYGDENRAMTAMAQGASQIAMDLCRQNRIDGLLVLGGTMGTDLALDVANALPLGLPKVVLSTISYSPLIPIERIPPDLTMILWAGGLYGLNSLCKATLSQAAGAIVGAAQIAFMPQFDRPIVGMTSLGKSCLKYMVQLKPALEARGFEVAVFHSTGMGGRAFESLARQGVFACVMDFCVQELTNWVGDSCVHAGADRMTGAGASGTPQLVAPGAVDMVDMPSWAPIPASLAGLDVHAHNRLISSASAPRSIRAATAQIMVERLAQAAGPTCLFVPTHGVQSLDMPGEGLYNPELTGHFVTDLLDCAEGKVDVISVDAHINDDAFIQAVLQQFDAWCEQGLIKSVPLQEAS